MDPQLEELYGPLHRIKFSDQMNHNLINGLKLQESNLNQSYANPRSGSHSLVSPNSNCNLANLNPSYANSSCASHPLVSSNPNCNLAAPSLGPDNEGALHDALHDDYDFSDVVLKYIYQVLMEEDEGEKQRTYHEPSALAAAEKSLYEVLGQKYPPTQTQNYLPEVKCDSLNESRNSSCISYSYNDTSSSSGPVTHNWSGYPYEYNPSPHVVDSGVSSLTPSLPTSYRSSNSSNRQFNVWQLNPESPFGSTSNVSGLMDGRVDSPVSALSVSDIFSDSRSMLQFQKGLEEASKFLPKGSLHTGLKNTEAHNPVVKLENGSENGIPAQISRGKKHRYPDGLQPDEGRDNKQSAVSLVSDEAVKRSEMFDRVLLCSGGKHDAALRESLQSERNKNVQNAQAKGFNSGKGRGKKQGNKRDVVDLRSLLSLCAQAVTSNDQRGANDLLRQIRQHSSPTGDGNQRVANYFADGLQARLAGVGTPIYRCIVTGPASAVDILRAYHMFLAVCPFKKMANFFSNRTIMAAAEKAKRLHIIDLGIVYGFQWPCLIQRLSSRPGGPPELRITGVDFPQPGFRPAKRLEETGRRLTNYAESFNVPFEFIPVAKKWETLTMEDLKIESDEVLVVNCMFRFKYIPDETVTADCPRDIVLNLIKQIKPAVFIQGVVNGAFNSPFFITRFREALFHFSTLFDMLEANLPRDTQERILIEREIFGRQAMNVIACEGLERIERPETYKQWQVRNERAGFRQLPLDREIVTMAQKRVSSVYHKDFVIDEDGHWLLQGWKGRIVYALTTWKPME